MNSFKVFYKVFAKLKLSIILPVSDFYHNWKKASKYNTPLKKITARKPIKNWIMHQRFLWLSKIPTHSQPILISQKALIYPSSWFFIILITKPVIKFTVKLKDHSWNMYATIRGREGEEEIVQIYMGREGGLFTCGYMLPLFLRNWGVLTQSKFIAIIHEVNNIRSSQPKHNNSLQWAFWYMNQLEPRCSF